MYQLMTCCIWGLCKSDGWPLGQIGVQTVPPILSVTSPLQPVDVKSLRHCLVCILSVIVRMWMFQIRYILCVILVDPGTNNLCFIGPTVFINQTVVYVSK